jgi:hypothetical protein
MEGRRKYSGCCFSCCCGYDNQRPPRLVQCRSSLQQRRYANILTGFTETGAASRNASAPSNTPPPVPTTCIIRARRISPVYVARSDLGQMARSWSDANGWVPPPPSHLFRRQSAMVSRRQAPVTPCNKTFRKGAIVRRRWRWRS